MTAPVIINVVADGTGHLLQLGPVIGEGGEGRIRTVEGDASIVAKIYRSAPTPERIEKLRLLAARRAPALDAVAAWPRRVLTDVTGTKVVGFTMPFIAGSAEIHELTTPRSRVQAFKLADWRFIIRAALNVARALAELHDTGAVVGDINQSGVLVGSDATARFIDVDSFQLEAGGRIFPCDVGVAAFTPPELQGKSLRGVVRSREHDSFALAVLIFLLLMMGRHPFAGRLVGGGDMPLPRAIAEQRYAFDTDPATGMGAPSDAPSIETVGADATALFRRAFRRRAGETRPTPREWIGVLSGLEHQMVRCPAHLQHWHLRGLGACPWCKLEGSSGRALFPGPKAPPFDLAALRAEVASIRHPGAAPDPVVATPSASSAAIAVRRRLRRARWLTIGWSTPLVALGLAGGGGPAAAAIIVAGGGAALALGRLGAFRGDISSLRRALSDAQRNWAAEWACWQERATPVRFDAAVAAFRSRCTSWEQLTQRYPTADLRAHLSRLEIAGAGIPGIGRGRTRKLEARGIKSAADFDRAVLAGVQELNAQLQANLLAWQAGHQRLFTEARNELAQLETDLRADVAHIRTEAAAVTAARRNPSSLITARTAVLQATADLAAVGR